MQQINVKKSNGNLVPLDYEKINKMAEFACDSLEDVSSSELAMKANLNFYDGIPTKEIQIALVDAAHDLTSELRPHYQYAAARLFLVLLRKEVYGQWTPPTLYDHIKKCTELGVYSTELLEKFTKEEINQFDSFIDHDRDFKFTYVGLRQTYDKYLIQDRVKGKRHESPQMRFIVMSMGMFMNDTPSERKELIKKQYDQISLHQVSYPTPIQAGVGGIIKQYASCTGIRTGDNLDSINASASAVVKYVSKRSGIGLDVSGIRAVNSKIRDGSTRHTGIIPFMKHFHSAVKSCSQGGIRGGAATMFYPIWHLEVESLLVLKNNKGTDETRIRHSDYGVKISKLFYKRFLENADITLFSPHEHKELFEAFHNDQEKFEKLYVEAEQNPFVMKKTINARKLFKSVMDERASTGRVYIVNIDHANTNTPFQPKIAPIYQSNLCLIGATKLVTKREINNDVAEYEFTTLEEINTLFNNNETIQVLSYNIETKLTEYKKVLNSAMTGKKQKVIKVTETVSGKYIICTPEHKVWTENRGYVEAQVLKENDTLQIFSPNNFPESCLVIEEVEQVYDVYDITVEDNHNFYANDILVHNCLEILIPNSPIHNIEEGYRKQLVQVIDKSIFDKAIKEHGFLPKSQKSTAYRLVNMDKLDDENASNLKHVNVQDDEHGEIFLCILAAINVGNIETDEELRDVCHTTVRALDNLITDQEYPVKSAEISAKLRRTLGIGITNLAYYFAKNGVRYSDGSANKLIHELMEKIQFYLIEASALLAKDRGVCDYYDQTTYAQGIMPIDRYNKNVDTIADFEYKMDWGYLRNLVKDHGMRHSTLSAQMPTESSSKVQACTSKCTVIPTSQGDITFDDLAKKFGINVEDLYEKGEQRWIVPSEKMTVTNRYGEQEEVTGLWYNGNQMVTEIEMEDGTIFKATENHRFLVNRDGEEIWVYVSDLQEEDDIVEVK